MKKTTIEELQELFDDGARMSLDAGMLGGNPHGVTHALLLLNAKIGIETLVALKEMHELIDMIDSRVMRLESRVVDGTVV